jgi:hypothetical protein
VCLSRLADAPAALRELATLGYATDQPFGYFGEVAAPWTGIEGSWISLAGLPDWRSRLSFLRAHLFPPAAYMRHRYGLRHPVLLPLAYVWRWLVGAGSGLAVAAALVRRRSGKLR